MAGFSAAGDSAQIMKTPEEREGLEQELLQRLRDSENHAAGLQSRLDAQSLAGIERKKAYQVSADEWKHEKMSFLDELKQNKDTIRALVAEAIAAEDEGREVPKAAELELVAELQDRLDGDLALRDAFQALTPGRRREYNLHIASAKRAATREERVTRCAERILAGKGLRDR